MHVYQATSLQCTPFTSSSTQKKGVNGHSVQTAGSLHEQVCFYPCRSLNTQVLLRWTICNLSKSPSLVCQTLFIHLWNRFFSKEECCCVEMLPWWTMLPCIPEEMEKDKSGEKKKMNATFLPSSTSKPLDIHHILFMKMLKNQTDNCGIVPTCVVSFSFSQSWDETWQSDVISTGYFPALLFKHFSQIQKWRILATWNKLH